MKYIQGHSVWSSLPDSQYWLLCSLLIVSFALGMLLMAYVSRRKQSDVNIEADTQHRRLGRGKNDAICENAFLSQQIRTVIKNLSNSQYVLKDDQSYTSLYQTPLRQSIHHLRLISETLLNNAESSGITIDVAKNNDDRVDSQFCFPLLVLQRQIVTLEKLCEQCGIHFSSQVDLVQETAVNVSEEWLAAAIHEVLVNAIKQNSKGLSLSISAHTANGALFINIVDDGVGISRAISQQFTETSRDVVHLFRRKSDSENLMNLSLIQDKLLSVGGRVVIKSARKFRTEVCLKLPVDKTISATQETSNQTSTHSANIPKLPVGNSATPRLLWIAPHKQSGHAPNNQLMCNLKQDFILREESTIEGALSCLTDYRPDCILIDEDAKANNSFLVKAWVQANDNFAEIPVVTMGGLLDKSTQLRMMQTGITATIEKPVVFSELRSVVNNVVAEKNKMMAKVEEAIANYHINAMDHIEYNDKEAERFLTQFTRILEQNFQDYDFRLVEAAKLMHMADKTLSRKISKYYQLKFGDLIKKYRLNKAKELIIQGERVTSVAYETGFNSASYFTQCFRAEFGFAPSMLAKER